MRTRSTRIVLVTTGCLAFGLLASVALAWALCLWPTRNLGNTFQLGVNSRPDGERSSHTVYHWSNTRSVGFRHVAIWQIPGHEPINRHAARRMREQIHAGKAGLPPDQRAAGPYVEPAWPSWLPTLPEDETEHAQWGARAAGWPLPCLASRSSATSTGPGAGVRQTSWSMRPIPATPTSGAAPQDPDRGAVPLRPLPLGLAANTLLFASPLIIVLVVVPTARGTIRRRRGLCPACGYERRGLEPGQPCPECGQVRANTETRTHRGRARAKA